MRASPHSSTGDVGAFEVAAAFSRIGWAPVPNRQEQDLGTDLLVAVRDAQAFDRGMLVGVQVKTGASWFGEPEIVGDRSVAGWWYREADTRHFDYWVKHQLPHLLVLYDVDSRIAYWVHVTADRCISTGKGLKILVPASQRVDEHGRTALFDIAVSQRNSISLEGTAFDAAAFHIPPGDRLRHALLVPRMVAPHPNRGRAESVAPEEAIALLTWHRFSQFFELMKKHDAWPDVNSPPHSNDWRWQFAYALYLVFVDNSIIALKECVRDANRADWRVCAVALLAATVYDQGDCKHALNLIEEELNQPSAFPIDHAWLQLLRARFATELGEREASASAVALALEGLASESEDVTASLLRGQAYRMQFTASLFASGSDDLLPKMIRATDNAASWWRGQQSFWAMDAAAEEHFRVWCEDRSWRFDAESPKQKLHGDIFLSGLSADQPGWQSASLRLGRHLVTTARSIEDLAEALPPIYFSANTGAIKLTCQRLRERGPCALLVGLLKIAAPETLIHSRVEAFRALWSGFGEFAEHGTATSIVEWTLCGLREGVSSSISESISRHDRLDILARAMSAAPDHVMIELVLQLPAIITKGFLEVQAMCRLIWALPAGMRELLPLSWLSEQGSRDEPDAPQTSHLLCFAAARGSQEARSALLTRVLGGDLLAAAIALNAKLLTEHEASKVAKTIKLHLDRIQSDAKVGRAGYGRLVEPAQLLAFLAMDFPAIDGWPMLISFLVDIKVNAESKESAVRSLVIHADRVPVEVKRMLLEHIEDVQASPRLPANPFSNPGERLSSHDLGLAIRLGFSDLTSEVIELLERSASSADLRLRVGAVSAMSFRPDPIFAPFASTALADPSMEVRKEAAALAAKLLSCVPDSSRLMNVVRTILADGGALIPMAFLREIEAMPPMWVCEAIMPLLQHPSSYVRRKAERCLGKSFKRDDAEAEK